MEDETETEWEFHPKALLKDAHDPGISSSGRLLLGKMLRKYRDVIRVRFYGRYPTKKPPLKVRVNPDKPTVRVTKRRYPPEELYFVQKYKDQLLKLVLVKHSSRKEWVAALLIVSKKPPVMFRLTMDYRLINVATLKTAWPIPPIDALLSDVQWKNLFQN